MKKYLILALSLAVVSCTKKEEPKAPNHIETCSETCDAVDQKICDSLIEEYDKCKDSKKESSCQEFVSAYSKALPQTVQCKNTCSEGPFNRSISSQCDNVDRSSYPKITERSAHLLAELKFKSAIDLLLSNEFNSILDGALAEDMHPKIEKIRTQNNK